MARDEGGATPEQFGAGPSTSKDALTSFQTPLFPPSDLAGRIYHTAARRPRSCVHPDDPMTTDKWRCHTVNDDPII